MERRSARRTALFVEVQLFSHSNDQESRIVVGHGNETRTKAMLLNHVDFVWKKDHTPTTTKGWRSALMPPCASRHIGVPARTHTTHRCRRGEARVAHDTSHWETINLANQIGERRDSPCDHNTETRCKVLVIRMTTHGFHKPPFQNYSLTPRPFQFCHCYLQCHIAPCTLLAQPSQKTCTTKKTGTTVSRNTQDRQFRSVR